MPIRGMNVEDNHAVFIDPVDPEPVLRSMDHHSWVIRQAVEHGYPLIIDYQSHPGWYRASDGKMAYVWEEYDNVAPRAVIERLIAEGVIGHWRYSGELGLEEFVVDDENSHPDIPKRNDWLKRKA